MRHHYDLTKQTIKVFSHNVPALAEEAQVSDKQIYAILAGTQTDPFAPFEHYYTAAVRAGNPVHHYDDRLAAIKKRCEPHRARKSLTTCLADKIEGDTKTTVAMIDALKDGVIDPNEAERISGLIEREREALDRLELHLQFKGLKAA